MPRKPPGFTRRDLLGTAALSAPLIAACRWAELPRASGAEVGKTPRPARPGRRVLRLAHLTDVHVQPELGAGDGLAACLRHMQGLKDPPQFVLTGGDAVMDVFGADTARAKVQADLWRSVWKSECSLPTEHCIGNHDVWGWDRKESRTAGDEPLWGKRWALDFYGLDRRYRAFSRAGWRFIVLDSVAAAADGYVARLGEEQFEWLAAELRSIARTTPVLVLSHIPILSIAAMLYGEQEKSGQWVIPASWVHIDARRIKDLFRRHPNVKLCLSGHIHLTDRVEVGGVTYLCNGAVCGDWWKGDLDGVDEGYAVIDLYDDGSFEAQYVSYGWRPRD